MTICLAEQTIHSFCGIVTSKKHPKDVGDRGLYITASKSVCQLRDALLAEARETVGGVTQQATLSNLSLYFSLEAIRTRSRENWYSVKQVKKQTK